MKTRLLLVATIAFTLAISNLTFGNLIDEKFVEITSEFNFEEEKISTFDNEKTISGIAPENSTIEIVVFQLNDEEQLEEVEEYVINVGTSEVFSQVIELELGENYIESVAYLDGYENIEQSVIVNRKDDEIKKELKKGIYIPGETNIKIKAVEN